jgi:co-chaperonin GroES (HSP10)
MRPVNKRVLVWIDQPGLLQGQKIIVPDAHKSEPNTGVVLAVGDGNDDVKPGDHVMVERQFNTHVTHEGKICWLLNRQDIVAVITANK